MLLLGFYRHVAASLKALMKDVQANGEVDEDELDDAVCIMCYVRALVLILLLNSFSKLKKTRIGYTQKSKNQTKRAR
jgi:hypothetical protein